MNERFRASAILGVTLFSSLVVDAADSDSPIGQRVPNNTLSLPLFPPQYGYSLTNAFPGVNFSQPLCIVSPPAETNRLFILEKSGNIAVITNLASPTRSIFMRLPVTTGGDDGLLGLAFHPGFATNRYFYAFFTRNFNTSQGNGRHMRLSRFEASPENPNLGLTNSELPLITQFDPFDYHHAGDCHFGPDGYLYISLGDGGPQRDGNNNSQTITKNFFSAILRLDVDKRPGNLLPNPHLANTTNYFIPADNPFVGATSFNSTPVDPNNVRTEFYAVGVRVPWRITFDRPTGQLYVADVGQDSWEEVDLVVKGGNYGWAFREGLHPGPKPPPPGFTSIDPIHEYSHGSGAARGNSITGGVVYRGQRLSQLYGAYLFADYVSGNVWILRANGTNIVPSERILGAAQAVAFGTDPRNGDVLIAQLGGQVMRLNYNTNAVGAPLPPTLADTGAFSDLASLTPEAGIVPYDLNVPFWSDGANKRRWFCIPDLNATMAFNREGNWSLPNGAVWIKHFDLELTNGVPESRHRLETRFLVRNSDGVYGITYRWNDSQSNATLVPEVGMDEAFVIHDGGLTRTQIWHYPSRAECLTCHTAVGGGALGFNTAQLNRDFDYGGVVANQILALSQAGYFSTNATDIHTLRALASATNDTISLEARVRSYLAANCSQCHQPGGPTTASFNTSIWTPLSEAGLVSGVLKNNGGDTNNFVITPGSADRSMLLTRISTRGPGQMPPLASTVLDTQAIALVSRWITNDLPGYLSFAAWQTNYFGSTNAAMSLADADPDKDRAPNRLEWLTATDPTNTADNWQIALQRSNDTVKVVYPRIANRGFEVQWTTNLANEASWGALDALENRPFFATTTAEHTVPDSITNRSAKYYRVRVFEP